MRAPAFLRRVFEPIMRIGEVEGESEAIRGGRRVFMVAFVIATIFTIPQVVGDLSAGYTRVGVLGIPGKIQLAPSTFELIRERYTCESRGSVQVKGKDPMTTYLLLGRL